MAGKASGNPKRDRSRTKRPASNSPNKSGHSRGPADQTRQKRERVGASVRTPAAKRPAEKQRSSSVGESVKTAAGKRSLSEKSLPKRRPPERRGAKGSQERFSADRDFRSIDRRPVAQGNLTYLYPPGSGKATAATGKNVKPPKRSKELAIQQKDSRKKSAAQKKNRRRQMQNQRKDMLYETKHFDVVDENSEARARRKQKRKPKLHAVSVILSAMAIFLATALVGIFLIFKLEIIEIEGESGYSKEEILNAGDFQLGDNLFFLPIQDLEKKIPKSLSYIDRVNITREIPNKITLEIIPAVVGAVISYQQQYVAVDYNGKIVDIQGENKWHSLMQVKGGAIQNPEPATGLVFEDEKENKAFQEIFQQLITLDALEEMTSLDLTNLDSIVLMYQNRIKMELGKSDDLSYKIHFGLKVAGKRKETDVGSINLRFQTALKQAEFTTDYNQIPNRPGGTAGSSTTEEDRHFEPFASNPGRGDDIPDEPYTKGSPGPPEGSSSEEEAFGEEGDFESEGRTAAEEGDLEDDFDREEEADFGELDWE